MPVSSLRINARLIPSMGLVRGVTHAEYIRAADGRFYFLEVAARVGGAFIADVIEHATGINLWREWARVEIGAMRGIGYTLPPTREEHAGSVLCLAKTSQPDTSMFTEPEIIYRMRKHHHAGLIVRSPDHERVRLLLEDYTERFAREYLAVAPPPLKPTA